MIISPTVGKTDFESKRGHLKNSACSCSRTAKLIEIENHSTKLDLRRHSERLCLEITKRTSARWGQIGIRSP
jgi:hypothetical protein